MSYILDALRRADAERQRGAVPGLHDQPGAPGPGGSVLPPAADRAGPPVLLWAGAAAVLVTALGTAWWLGRGAAPAPAAAMPGATAPLPAAAPAVAAAPLPAAPVDTTPVVQAATSQAPAAPTAVLPPAGNPAPAARAPAQAPVARNVPSGPPPLSSRPPVVALMPGGATAPSAAPTAGPAAAAGVPVAPAEAASDPVRAWASLPPSTRAALPALAWSGVVYAERADQRLVVVNGQVAREGDVLGTGLQLLQIRPKSVLLRWQGQRIEMPL